MDARRIAIEPLTREAFAPFGQVIDFDGATRFPINAGAAQRIHDLAQVEVTGPAARAAISLVRGKPYPLPLTLPMVERHPLGTQSFHPLGPQRFLVVVAPDEGGIPGRPRAFLTAPGQGVNYARGTWHGLLTPLDVETDFLVVDRMGEGDNCQEHFYPEPWLVVAG
jgi:ureidoglycolate lyase